MMRHGAPRRIAVRRSPGGATAVATLGVFVALAAAPASARAFLDRPLRGAHAAGAGDAFVAVADDAGALQANVAALAGLGRVAGAAYRAFPDRAGGDEAFVGAAVPTRLGVLGAGWVARARGGGARDERLTVALARDLARTSEEAALSVGVALDVLRARSLSGAADATAAGAAAVFLQPFSGIALAWQARNIAASDLAPAGQVESVRVTQAWGAAWTWNRRAVLAVERRRDADGAWHTHAGVDARVGPGVRLRAGSDAGEATFGAGVRRGALTADVAVSARPSAGRVVTLGVTWRGRAR